MPDANSWNWKAKDGAEAGLLYEPGNWGDLLKLLWLTTIAEWHGRSSGQGAMGGYFDPFAGDVVYPLGSATRNRFTQAKLQRLDFLRGQFLQRGVWPSAATVAGSLFKGSVTVWDADEGRRCRWAESGVAVADGRSGVALLKAKVPAPGDVWLIDPYDFLADWRELLPIVVEKAETASVIVYAFNRSAKNPEAFREYRAFRNALAGARHLPTPMGRVPSDGFLPKAHHEVFYFPARAECEGQALPDLLAALEDETNGLAGAVERAAVFSA